MNVIQELEKAEAARLLTDKKIPAFQPGDTLRVNVRIKEGERERVGCRPAEKRGSFCR